MLIFNKLREGFKLLVKFDYKFDHKTMNLLSRKDGVRNTFENFEYDELNRLTYHDDSYYHYAMTYDSKGNISTIDDIGSFTYDESSPYAPSQFFADESDYIKEDNIQYNSLHRPSIISNKNGSISYTYDVEGNKKHMIVKDAGGGIKYERYYLIGNFELDIYPTKRIDRLYLNGDAYSAPAVYEKDSGTGKENLLFICRDYLGSITHLVDETGNIVEENSFSPSGWLRNSRTLKPYIPFEEPTLRLGRGFTGHEHLTGFGLINMNARLYDPIVGRFISPDPYVQMPDFSQNFNRYSYALNNPLKYRDTSGEAWQFLIGALVGGTVNWAFNGFKFNAEGLGYFGAGVGGGLLLATGNPAGIFAGGAFTSGANSAIHQYATNKSIQWDQVGISAIVGGAAAYGGSWLGGKIAPYAERMFQNVGYDALRKGLIHGTTGAGSGVVVGGGMGYATTGDLDGAIEGTWKGGMYGFGIGFSYGFGRGMYDNWQLNSALKLQKPTTYNMQLDPDGDNVTLYRGTTGSEGDKGALFMTDDLGMAKTYVKNGGQVIKVVIPRSTLNQMYHFNDLTYPTGLHTLGGNNIVQEYMFSPQQKAMILKHSKPYIP